MPQNTKDFKEKKTAKLIKRKDKEVLQTWYDLARSKGIVAAQVNQEQVATGHDHELGGGITKTVLELMQEYPLERLKSLRDPL